MSGTVSESSGNLALPRAVGRGLGTDKTKVSPATRSLELTEKS